MPDFLISPKNPWLAPLAGFSDLPFRLLCRKYGCDVAETEMVSAKGLFYNLEQNLKYISTTKEDNPLIVQIFGSDAKIIRRAVENLRDRGYRYFDLNAGCPVKKVTKTGAGAALLKDVLNLAHILEEMAYVAGSKNIGVKIRLGWNSDSLVYLEIGRIVERLDIGWLTLHPRYAKQGFSGHANWDYIKELKEYINVPIIASGDLFTPEDGIKCIEYTGADSLMFARGALKNPVIFAQYKGCYKNRSISDLNGYERIQLIRDHMDLIRKYGGEKNPFFKMRGILSRYIRGYYRSKFFREKAVKVSSWEDIESLIHLLEEEVR